MAERYFVMDLDGGGAGHIRLKESQELVLSRYLAPAEERVAQQVAAGEPTDGILLYWHKARQLYATTTAIMLLWHRLLTIPNSKGLGGVAEDDKLAAYYSRHERLYSGLPWWLRPGLKYESKGEHLVLDGLDSSVWFAAGNQKGGMGQGNQYELQHLTECAFWLQPEYHIDYVLKDTLPQSPWTLAIRESTANGRGNWWHTQTEEARKGYATWGYIFVPWYAVGEKRRRKPKDGTWQPDPQTIKHAELVLRTSPEWMGRTVQLDLEQLYWWESERKEMARKNALSLFYSNCVAGDTLVSTDSGIKRIDQANLAHSVESGDVTGWYYRGVRDVLEMRTKMGRKLIATPDHPVFLYGSGLKLMGELQPGDKIALSPPKFAPHKTAVHWSPIPLIESRFFIDEDFGRLLGYFMGDGCYGEGRVSFAVTRSDQDVVQDISWLIRKFIGKGPEIVHRGGCTVLRSSSIYWKIILSNLRVLEISERTQELKRKVCVPACIFESPRSVVKAFLSSLFESDGCIYPQHTNAVLSGKGEEFMQQVQLLLLGFGINSLLKSTANRVRGRVHRGYILRMRATGVEIFLREIGFISERKRAMRGRTIVCPKKSLGVRKPNEMADEVESVVSAGLAQVYDLTVYDTHRFGANGITVHNCPATPEESFQHFTRAAFSAEQIESWRAETSVPTMAMEVVTRG